VVVPPEVAPRPVGVEVPGPEPEPPVEVEPFPADVPAAGADPPVLDEPPPVVAPLVSGAVDVDTDGEAAGGVAVSSSSSEPHA